LWWREFWRIFDFGFWIFDWGDTNFTNWDGEGTGFHAETWRRTEGRKAKRWCQKMKRNEIQQEAAERAVCEELVISDQSSLMAGLGWRRMSPVLKMWSDDGGVLVGSWVMEMLVTNRS
jgi:hypothetical protein